MAETRAERLARLRKAAKESAAATNELLADELSALKSAVRAQLDALRPKVQDKEAFDKLVAAVEASTKANESRAKLRERIAALGAGVRDVAKQVAQLLK